jgi:hypothetical protein
MLGVLLILAQTETRATQPAYFAIVTVGLLLLGLVGWLVAAVLGFARAKAFGPAVRWFAIAAVCLIIYHLQFLVVAFGLVLGDPEISLGFGAFFNLFVVIASVCAIFGFMRLTSAP